MKLDRPFIQLPFRYDVQRLAAEVNQFDASDWREHPQKYNGNSALRLITNNGDDNDDVRGDMLPTPLLLRCPYIQQIIQSFGVVIGRSRLMKLAPYSVVPEHSDTNYHWFNKVRIHIPIITNPKVLFHCGDSVLHMQAGEAWIFDNWLLHKVENKSEHERVHLVIDTVGSSSFWEMTKLAAQMSTNELKHQTAFLDYRYADSRPIVTEVDSGALIVSPYEIKHLCDDFYRDIRCSDAIPDADRAIEFFRYVVTCFCQDWQALFAQHGQNSEALPYFRNLIERARTGLNSIPMNIVMRSNNVPAKSVFVSRVVQGAIREKLPETIKGKSTTIVRQRCSDNVFEKPVIIVAAPRSGSTLLFETLAKNEALKSIGGESHEIFEGIAGLNPATGSVIDNRLTTDHFTKEISEKIKLAFNGMLKNFDGTHFVSKRSEKIRLLEKTPKNALRIPFLNKLFPDALFVYLYREPKSNIGSIIDAWASCRWVTYPSLPGRNKPWSLLLPPGWQQFHFSTIEEIAAFQWAAANQQIMDDLSLIESQRYVSVTYQELVDCPGETVDRICAFAGLPISDSYRRQISTSLPYSRYTLSAPRPDKWLAHETSLRLLSSKFQSTSDHFFNWREKHGGG